MRITCKSRGTFIFLATVDEMKTLNIEFRRVVAGLRRLLTSAHVGLFLEILPDACKMATRQRAKPMSHHKHDLDSSTRAALSWNVWSKLELQESMANVLDGESS